MARYHKQRPSYPIGSVSSGTMRPEDLIPTFLSELEHRLKHGPKISREARKAHFQLLRNINKCFSEYAKAGTKDGNSDHEYYQSGQDEFDLDSLMDALGEYAAPYFYFGSHSGDGADYGYWLSENFDQDFLPVTRDGQVIRFGTPTPYRTLTRDDMPCSIKVADLAYVPKWFRGEVLHVNDHGNMTLYVKTSRTLREVWGIV